MGAEDFTERCEKVKQESANDPRLQENKEARGAAHKARYRELGIDEETAEKVVKTIEDAVKERRAAGANGGSDGVGVENAKDLFVSAGQTIEALGTRRRENAFTLPKRCSSDAFEDEDRHGIPVFRVG